MGGSIVPREQKGCGFDPWSDVIRKEKGNRPELQPVWREEGDAGPPHPGGGRQGAGSLAALTSQWTQWWERRPQYFTLVEVHLRGGRHSPADLMVCTFPVTAAAARFPKCSGLNNRNLSSPSSGDRKYKIEVWAGPGSLQRLRRWGLPAWCAFRGCPQSWRPLASSCIITMVSLCLHHHGPSSISVCVSKSSFLNKTTGHWVRPHPNQQDLIFI